MPTLGGALAALLAGWIIEDLARPYLGPGLTLAVSFGVSTVVFFVARKWLIELRGR